MVANRPVRASDSDAPVLPLLEAWRRENLFDEARTTLDAALEEHPEAADLWRARLLFEEFASDAARDDYNRRRLGRFRS